MTTSILVTGANGLLGRAMLSRLGHSRRVYALVREAPEHPLPGNITMIVHDLRNSEAPPLPEIPETILHMAQSPLYRDFPEGALDVFEINVGSTQRLLDWASRHGVKRFIYASSGGVYGRGNAAFREDAQIDAATGLGHYFACKRCGEILTTAYQSQMAVIVLRFFFVYGPGQRSGMLIPNLLDKVMHNRSINLQGNDGIRINPIFVVDAATAIEAATTLQASETINVAGPQVLSLREIATLIGDATGYVPRFEVQPEDEPEHLIACIDKMKRLLGAPLTGMAEGLRRMMPVSVENEAVGQNGKSA